MKFRTALLLFAAVGPAGCGGRAAPKPPAPLAVADWQGLPADQKYTAETLERLKEGDPGLQTPAGWDAFQKTVVRPARKRDFPRGPSR